MYSKIYFVGTGHVASACLQVLADKAPREKILCLGIEEEPFQTTAKVCSRLGVPFFFVGKMKAKDFLLKVHSPSLLLSAHNAYIFPAEVVENRNLKIINFHNAYLPDYRGRNAPTWEIFYGESYAGATWHEVSTGIDTGGIIVQERIPIGEDDTAIDVLMKSASVGVRLLDENLSYFLEGKYVAKPANTVKKLYLSSDIPNDGYLDLQWPIKKAYAFLRAMDYKMYPVMPRPKVKYKDELYEILEYGLFDKSPWMEQRYIEFSGINSNKNLYCLLGDIT